MSVLNDETDETDYHSLDKIINSFIAANEFLFNETATDYRNREKRDAAIQHIFNLVQIGCRNNGAGVVRRILRNLQRWRRAWKHRNTHSTKMGNMMDNIYKEKTVAMSSSKMQNTRVSQQMSDNVMSADDDAVSFLMSQRNTISMTMPSAPSARRPIRYDAPASQSMGASAQAGPSTKLPDMPPIRGEKLIESAPSVIQNSSSMNIDYSEKTQVLRYSNSHREEKMLAAACTIEATANKTPIVPEAHRLILKVPPTVVIPSVCDCAEQPLDLVVKQKVDIAEKLVSEEALPQTQAKPDETIEMPKTTDKTDADKALEQSNNKTVETPKIAAVKAEITNQIRAKIKRRRTSVDPTQLYAKGIAYRPIFMVPKSRVPQRYLNQQVWQVIDLVDDTPTPPLSIQNKRKMDPTEDAISQNEVKKAKSIEIIPETTPETVELESTSEISIKPEVPIKSETCVKTEYMAPFVKKDEDEIFMDYVLSELRAMNSNEVIKMEFKQSIKRAITTYTNKFLKSKISGGTSKK